MPDSPEPKALENAVTALGPLPSRRSFFRDLAITGAGMAAVPLLATSVEAREYQPETTSGSCDGIYAPLNPWGEIDPPKVRKIAPRLAQLDGKTIGLFVNMKRAANPILTLVEAKLRARYPNVQTVRFEYLENADIQFSVRRGAYERWLNGVDAVIAGVGDCGSCTKFLVYNTMFAEDRGKPTACLVNTGFMEDATLNATLRGMPGLRLISETAPPESTETAQIERGVGGAIDRILDALTRPLTQAELNPKVVFEPVPKMAKTGSLAQVNRDFYENGWTDGLPIVPPTREAVAEMMKGSDLPPDHVIAPMIPRFGKATVEKIAVNAVMAGALPTHLPVIIAAVKALENPAAGFGTTFVGTASWAPFWVINGPIRRDIELQSGVGALNPGDISNAAIGRAINLMIRNIGGIHKGVEDMGLYGNPMKYAMVMGEHEEQSPWPTLASEQGITDGGNALTLSFASAFVWVMLPGSDADSIMEGIAASLFRPGGTIIIMNPTRAAALSAAGWTKAKMVDYLVENARFVPIRRRPAGSPAVRPQNPGRAGGNRAGARARLNPDDVRVMVAGGKGTLGVAIVSNGGGFATQRVSQKIEVPQNWARLVADYKGIYPRYRDTCGEMCGF